MWGYEIIRFLILELLYFSVMASNVNDDDIFLQCLMDEMRVNLATRRPFYGKIYAHASPDYCANYGIGEKQIQLALPFENSHCGVYQEEPDIFVAIVIIQYHPLVQKHGDRALRLVCDLRVKNYTVSSTFSMAVDHIHGGGIVNSSAPSPHIRLRILGKRGNDVTDVKLGQELIIKVEIDENSIFGLAPRGLIASSGHSNEHIELLDGNGCPTDTTIFPGLIPNYNSKKLQGHFQAFKFSDDIIVRFHMNVQFCVRECPTIVCDYARRTETKSIQKRSSRKIRWDKLNFTSKTATTSLSDPFLPLQKEIIVDASSISAVPYPPTENSSVSREDEEDLLCVTKTILILIIVAATILQICIVVTCIICIWVSKRYRNDDADSVHSDNILIQPQNGDTMFYGERLQTRL